MLSKDRVFWRSSASMKVCVVKQWVSWPELERQRQALQRRRVGSAAES